jgi:hypothetical protein
MRGQKCLKIDINQEAKNFGGIVRTRFQLIKTSITPSLIIDHPLLPVSLSLVLFCVCARDLKPNPTRSTAPSPLDMADHSVL